MSACRLEHWQVLLQDAVALRSLHRVLEDVAHGCVPGGRLGLPATAFLLDGLTPLAKPGGGVRSIAVPEPLRRLLARAVTTQFRDTFAEALCPLQCAVGLAGGAEVAHKTVSSFAALHPNHVFLKFDIENAYNSMLRSACVEQPWAHSGASAIAAGKKPPATSSAGQGPRIGSSPMLGLTKATGWRLHSSRSASSPVRRLCSSA